jgi:hypothetical protein
MSVERDPATAAKQAARELLATYATGRESLLETCVG